MTTAMKTEHTPLPWSIRPQELDDWGVVRGSNGNISCLARSPEYFDDDTLNEHRKNKTDPTLANAALIVRAVNSYNDLVKALEASNAFHDEEPAAGKLAHFERMKRGERIHEMRVAALKLAKGE